jgi:hypothetical protein
MPSLKDAIHVAKQNGDVGSTVGFKLVKPKLHRFKNPDGFLKSLKEQAESIALIPGDKLDAEISIDGDVGKTGWRLSNAAFGDLCHWTRTPVSFIKRLAKIDEELALRVLAEMIGSSFYCLPDKQLVIDVREGRIDGIVGMDSYAHVSNAEVVEWALSATPDLGMSQGWTFGPTMRVTCISEQRKAEPVKGDIVKMGMTLQNAVHGDCSVKVSDYAFRLACLNGLVAREHQHTESIRHVGDVKFNVQKAIVGAANRSEHMIPYMEAAAKTLLGPVGIKHIRKWVGDSKAGGSPSLDDKVTQIAQEEAHDEGRAPEEVTLWNFVNGITASAKDAKTINRQTELEAFGYRTLVRFGAVLTGS